MPHDWPAVPDLLVTVREFVDEIMPRLDGQDRYHALCALYLLDIAGRELEAEWARQPGADDARIAALVEGGEALSPTAAVTALCHNIRAGKHDESLPELFEVLAQHVSDKVRISKPEYLASQPDMTPAREDLK